MRKTKVRLAAVVMAVVCGSLAFAGGFSKPESGTFSGGSGSWTNGSRRRALSAVMLWGSLGTDNATIRLEVDTTLCTSAPTSPIIAEQTNAVETLSYIDGAAGLSLEPGAIIYFTTATTNALKYVVIPVRK